MTKDQLEKMQAGRQQKSQRKLHKIRSSKGDGSFVEVKLTRSSAIKAFCSECLGWEIHPKDCTDKHCPLYLFRGKTLIAKG